MFETNASAFQFLIPNLLKLFADAEQAVGPYEKFNVRQRNRRHLRVSLGNPGVPKRLEDFFRNQVAILREVC